MSNISDDVQSTQGICIGFIVFMVVCTCSSMYTSVHRLVYKDNVPNRMLLNFWYSSFVQMMLQTRQFLVPEQNCNSNKADISQNTAANHVGSPYHDFIF